MAASTSKPVTENPGMRKGLGQRQADVAQPDDTDPRRAIPEAFFQVFIVDIRGVRHPSRPSFAKVTGYRASRGECQRDLRDRA